MADKALYIGIDGTGKSVPLKIIDNSDGTYALKVTTTSGGGGGPTNALLTEAGDFLQTEDGNYLVQE